MILKMNWQIYAENKEEIKEENDLKAVYASIIAQYDEYEEEEDDYIRVLFPERQSLMGQNY